MKEMDGKTMDGEHLAVEHAGTFLWLRAIGAPKSSGGRSRGPQADDKCFNCGGYGHWYLNLVLSCIGPAIAESVAATRGEGSGMSNS